MLNMISYVQLFSKFRDIKSQNRRELSFGWWIVENSLVDETVENWCVIEARIVSGMPKHKRNRVCMCVGVLGYGVP